MTDSPIGVLIVDDQALARTGLRMVLELEPDIDIVGEAADGEEAVRVAAETSPDVILMDVRMPTMDGVTATRELVRRHPDRPRIVVLTTFDLDEYAFEALRAGASGFLLKDAPAEDVLAAIRTVHGGDAVIAASTTRRILDHIAADLPGAVKHDDRISALTARERDVMVAIAQGATNSEIAASLHLAEATVKTHVGRILNKLALRDRVQIVIHAYETGLVRRGRY